jgi:membrane protease subunit HflC
MGRLNTLSILAVAVVLLVVSTCVFTVDERERAILLRLGQIQRSGFEPGLYFKLPYPIDEVKKFDGRLQTLDAEPEEFLTKLKKSMLVDSFVKWRISDEAVYYKTMGGLVSNANLRLSQIVQKGLRDEFGKRSIYDVISGERAKIMEILAEELNAQAKGFGIDVVDVRIKRIDLPQKVSESVYSRMRAERERVANEFRARGAQVSEEIRANADRQRTEITSTAYGKAERIRGEGDAKAAELYAGAYGKNPEFYALYRRLLAYRNVFSSKDDLVVMQPDDDFFRYFNKPEPGR